MNNLVLNDLSVYGEEFTLVNGNPACLLIHGFGSGPILMREIGEYLHRDGHTARGFLLPGHCRNMGGIACGSHHSWFEKVESEYQQLSNKYKEVVVVGFSLGALLAMQLAIKYPIKKIILLSIPLFLVREYLPISFFIKIFKNFTPRIRTWRRKCYMESEIYSGYLYHPIDTYYSFQAIEDMITTIEIVKPGLKDITSSTLIIHSKRDGVADPLSAGYVLEHLGSPDKQLLWLEQSHHYILCDNEKHIVFDSIRNFLK
ncbi:MAG: alpha/beta fold hydrolase [wastewater metagenome]|nr:alpha/beta fold hydrolase [Candidatus Loosdrechtia aerotolerans]